MFNECIHVTIIKFASTIKIKATNTEVLEFSVISSAISVIIRLTITMNALELPSGRSYMCSVLISSVPKAVIIVSYYIRTLHTVQLAVGQVLG